MIFVAFVLFALSFGLVNTLLMSILERTKEIAMLLSVGMNKKKVFSLIILESTFLSLVGGILGILFGYFFTYLLTIKGIDLSALASEGFEGMGFSAVVKPYLPFMIAVYTTILVIITGILGSVYPALKAIKINPAIALKSDI